MKLSNLLIAGTMLAGVAATVPAQASAVCPATISTSSLFATPGACNLIFTFNADGTTTTSADPLNTGNLANYDGSDDALIGVVNNSGHALASFSLSDTSNLGIFGFDGADGIDFFITGVTAGTTNPLDTSNSGYGGINAYFTNIVGVGVPGAIESGTVNFVTPIANNSVDYFSLEQSIPVGSAPTVVPTPEPASMLVLGAGLAGLGLIRRRKA